MEPRYIIISPVRNEGKFLPGTISSVTNQTILPVKWVIVDDGSSDSTSTILKSAQAEFPWIKVVTRQDRGIRKPGTGVIEAFYDGYREAKEEWDFLVKLDGDVTFEQDYFESCFKKFFENPKLGIGGGLVCNLRDGGMVPESLVDPRFHVRGATKIYKRECWAAIGELIQAPGWDTLDELKANMVGWSTLTFTDIKILHHKPAGSADGTWKNWVKNGLANYIVGYHPAFMVLKCLRRTFCRPYLLGAAGLLSGFLSGYVRGVPQISDKELIRYLRREQLKRLSMQDSLWN